MPPGGVPVASPCRSRPYHSNQSTNLIKAFSAVAWRQVAGKQRHRVSRSSSFAAMTTLATLDAAVQRHGDIITTEILHVDPGSFPWQDAGALSAIDSDSLAPVALAANPPTPTYTSDLSHLRRAAELLQQEEVVAIPTETVYGLAANALSASAVRKIFAAKQRPSDNPLIIHISSLDMLRALYPDGSSIPPIYTPILARHWPGPLTILLPRSPLVPEAVTCGQPTMAVRLPSHPVARTLIALCGFPLAAPSANSSGRPSPTLAHHVLEDLKGRLPLIIDGGACSSGLESTVLDALRQPPAILRPGGVTYEQLRQLEGLAGLQVYRRDFVDSQLEAAPSTPGMKYRHYSPDAKVVLVDMSGCSTDSREQLQQRLRECTQQQLEALRSQGLTHLGVLSTSRQGASPGLQQQQQAGAAAAAAAAAAGAAGAAAASLQQDSAGILNGHAGSGSVAPGSMMASSQVAGSAAAAATSSGAAGSSTGSLSGPVVVEYVLGSFDQPGQVGQQLFRGLRELDSLGVQAVVVEGVVEEREGLAVMNRIRKAASLVVSL